MMGIRFKHPYTSDAYFFFKNKTDLDGQDEENKARKEKLCQDGL